MFNLHPSLLKGFSFDNAFSVIYGYNKNASYKSKGLNGEFLPLIPPMKINSSMAQIIQLKSKIVDAITLKAEAEVNSAQNRYLALNDTETATAGYTLLNMSLIAPINYSKNKTLHFQFQVNNLLDKTYQSNLSRLKYLNSREMRLGLKIKIKSVEEFDKSIVVSFGKHQIETLSNVVCERLLVQKV